MVLLGETQTIQNAHNVERECHLPAVIYLLEKDTGIVTTAVIISQKMK